MDRRLQFVRESEITVETFVRGSHISGSVSGIQDYGQYRVIVYVKTDMWYIHPYHGSVAQIDDRGEWEIESEDRSPSPTRIAVFLVRNDYRAPSKINRTNQIKALASAFADYY